MIEAMPENLNGDSAYDSDPLNFLGFVQLVASASC